mgnify:CR=1 FL=1
MAYKKTRPDPLPQTANGHVTAAAHLDGMAAKARHIRDVHHEPRSEDYRRLSSIADRMEQGSWALQAWVDFYGGRWEPDEPEETSTGTTKRKSA